MKNKKEVGLEGKNFPSAIKFRGKIYFPSNESLSTDMCDIETLWVEGRDFYGSLNGNYQGGIVKYDSSLDGEIIRFSPIYNRGGSLPEVIEAVSLDNIFNVVSYCLG